jgi:hypothetical protein
MDPIMPVLIKTRSRIRISAAVIIVAALLGTAGCAGGSGDQLEQRLNVSGVGAQITDVLGLTDKIAQGIPATHSTVSSP